MPKVFLEQAICVKLSEEVRGTDDVIAKYQQR